MPLALNHKGIRGFGALSGGLRQVSRGLWRSVLPPSIKLRRAGEITVRTLAGVGGGYVVAALVTIVLSAGLPMPQADAVLTATMASFAVYAATLVWSFGARSAWWACAGIAGTAALLALVLHLMQGQLP